MAKVSVQVEVSKETWEFALALGSVVRAARQALADGFQAEQDAPVIVLAALKDLLPAIKGLDQVGAELAEDKAAFAKALGLGLADVLGAVLPAKAPSVGA